MKITHRIEKQVAVLRPDGFLAADSMDIMKDLVDRLLAEQEIRTVVINWENITILDSSGIGLLFRIHKLLLRRESGIVLCGVNPEHLAILSQTGLLGTFCIYDSEQEALLNVWEGRGYPKNLGNP